MQKKVSISIEEKIWSDYIYTLEERTGAKNGKGHIGTTIEKLNDNIHLQSCHSDYPSRFFSHKYT